MIEALPFTYLHVFTYSARPGTLAAEQPGQVPIAVARERNRVLREIASKKKAAFMRSLVGTVLEAITLRSGGAEFTEALTDNYLKMRISGHHAPNCWMDVQVEGVSGEMLLGNPSVDTRLGACSDRSEVEHPACSPADGSDSGVHGSEQTH
jgi:threonylcarbamoyladenosine tRNA methylthiotransferase MtaB